MNSVIPRKATRFSIVAPTAERIYLATIMTNFRVRNSPTTTEGQAGTSANVTTTRMTPATTLPLATTMIMIDASPFIFTVDGA